MFQKRSALPSDRMIRTVRGRHLLGDVKPGDVVLGADGQPAVVLSASQWLYCGPVYQIDVDDDCTLAGTPGLLIVCKDRTCPIEDLVVDQDLISCWDRYGPEYALLREKRMFNYVGCVCSLEVGGNGSCVGIGICFRFGE